VWKSLRTTVMNTGHPSIDATAFHNAMPRGYFPPVALAAARLIP